MTTLSYQDGFDQVNQALKKCLNDAEASTILLCERSGSVIAMESDAELDQSDNVAALAAGAFFASREIARMLGEDEFNTVSQRGKKVGLFVQAIDGDFLLMVVYGDKTNQGLVKHYTGIAQNKVQNLFEACPDLKNPVRLVAGTSFELNFEADVYKRA